MEREKPSESNWTFLPFFFVELSSFPFMDATTRNAEKDVLQNISTFKIPKKKKERNMKHASKVLESKTKFSPFTGHNQLKDISPQSTTGH